MARFLLQCSAVLGEVEYGVSSGIRHYHSLPIFWVVAILRARPGPSRERLAARTEHVRDRDARSPVACVD
jgi:hypothetical protein